MDVFKMDRIPMELHKPLPEKVTTLQHVDDSMMLKAADTSFGYKHKKTWSSEMIEFGQGKNVTTRLFDKVIASGYKHEQVDDERTQKLRAYYE